LQVEMSAASVTAGDDAHSRPIAATISSSANARALTHRDRGGAMVYADDKKTLIH